MAVEKIFIFVIIGAVVSFVWWMFRKLSDWFYYLGLGLILAILGFLSYYFFLLKG